MNFSSETTDDDGPTSISDIDKEDNYEGYFLYSIITITFND